MYETKVPGSVWLPKRRLRALKPAWEARGDARAGAEALGTWFHDGLVIRAAFDRLRAFDIETGEQRWAWGVPGRDVLGAMSDEVVEGVGVVVHWPDTIGCREAAVVTALDTTSGKTLWSSRQGLDELQYSDSGLRPGTVGLSGERAMVATGAQVVALDIRTGRPAWTVPHGRADEVRIGAGGDRLVLVTRRAGTATVKLVAADDGTVRWTKMLPFDGPVRQVRILAARPLLLAAEGEGRRDPNAVLRLTADGDIATEISLDDDRGRMAPYFSRILADERRWVTWSGDTLMTFVDPSKYAHLSHLAGFSLSTGRHLWTWGDGWGIDALACQRGHVIALRYFEDDTEGRLSWWCRVHVLNPADGREVARRRLRVTGDEPYTMHWHGSRMLWVSKKSGPGTPPVKAFDWR